MLRLSLLPGVLWLAVAADIPTPLFSSWGQVAIFVAAVGGTVGWLWKVVRDKRLPATRDQLEMVTFGQRLAEFQGRISERTTLQGEQIDRIAIELATVDKRIAVELAVSEARWLKTLERLEDRVGRLEHHAE